jgi:hypothetical protein
MTRQFYPTPIPDPYTDFVQVATGVWIRPKGVSWS